VRATVIHSARTRHSDRIAIFKSRKNDIAILHRLPRSFSKWTGVSTITTNNGTGIRQIIQEKLVLPAL
jgi:hypothetical protein